MTHPLLNLITDNINGASFISIDTETLVKLSGGKNNMFQGRVAKRTIGSNVMVFQNKKSNGYANMIHRRLEQEGKDPRSFELSPRVWGTRMEGLPFVTHNDGLYFEVIFLKHGEVTYLVDGKPYDKNKIVGLPSHDEADQGGLDRKVIIRTFKCDSIRSIVINHERYDF